MELSTLPALAPANSLSPGKPSAGVSCSSQSQQLRESCQQFEAILWRTVLQNTQAFSLAGEDQTADPTGAYRYFFNDTVAQAVSGSRGGFADALYQQLSRHLQNTPTTAP